LQNEELSQVVFQQLDELGFLNRPDIQLSETFPCQTFSRNATRAKATSVHRLSPADIKVIAAVGDSLTAGTGIKAKTIIGVLTQYRGSSFSVGGDEKFSSIQTLANILRLYNPNLVGYSIKTGKVTSSNAKLNRAIPGEESPHLLAQVEDLIQKLKTDGSVNFNEDWKMISVLIGNNDICDFCNRDNSTVEFFQEKIEAGLDLLHQNVPNAIVNLISLFDVPQVPALNIGLLCSGLHLYACPCAAYSKDINKVILLTKQYQEALQNIASSGKYDTRDDFTVVLQPFFRNTKIPLNSDGSPDLSYFSPDCFHLSAKGHAEAAKALWNNLLEKVQSKQQFWYKGEAYNCPDPVFPYFYTNKNSA